MPPSIPQVIGKYAIERWIESGGMGDIFLARDPTLDRPVAIKFLREGFDNEEMRERFEREARAAGRLSHPNIVTIYEFGEFDGRPFIAMEFVPGESLSKLIRRREPIPVVRRLEMMEGLCAGLAHAHKAGIVHRDIKPANLMVDAEGSLKVLDFGIVRMAGSGLTHHGVLVGTVNYMSPEQIAGSATIDHRSDVFAVGAVLYEIFAYRRAFPGEMAEVLYKIVHGEPEPLGAVCPGIDPVIDRAVARCLDKNPDRRYQDLTVLRRELARVRHRLEIEESQEPLSQSGSTLFFRGTPPSGIPAPGGDTPAPSDAARQAEIERRQREESDRLRAAEIERQQRLEAERRREEEERLRRAEAERQRLIEEERRRAEAAEQARREAERQRLAEEQRRREEQAERARRRNERLQAAKQAIEADNATAARIALNEAAALGASPNTLAALKAQLDARVQELQRAMQAVDRGQRRLADGDAAGALALAEEALRLRPSLRDAARLRDRATRAIEEAQAREARARATIEAARSALQQGRVDAALEALEELHRAEPDRPDLAALLQEARAAKEARLAEERAELERRQQAQERQRTIESLLRQARAATTDGQIIAALNRIFEVDPENADARALLEKLRQAQEQRRRQREAQFARARQAVTEGRFDDAVQLLRPLATGGRTLPGFDVLLKEAEAGAARLEAQRRREQAIAQELASASERLAQQDFKGALARVQAVLQQEPSHAPAVALRDEIVRAGELYARALSTVERARMLASEGMIGDGLSLLESFSPEHPLVDAALADLRERHAARELERLRAERRARRQAAIRRATGSIAALARNRVAQIAATVVLAVGVLLAWWLRSEPSPAPTSTAAVTTAAADEAGPTPVESLEPQPEPGTGSSPAKPAGTTAARTETASPPGGARADAARADTSRDTSSASASAPRITPPVTRPEPEPERTPPVEPAAADRREATPPATVPSGPGLSDTPRLPTGNIAARPSAPEYTPSPVEAAGKRAETTPEPAVPATKPPDPAERVRQEIRQWVAEYERAYAALDVSRVRAMQPASQLGRERALLNSASAQFSNVVIDVASDGQSATLRASVTYSKDARRGGRSTNTANIQWTLVRTGNGWVAK
ncbi:MAG TPA: protein kinase [Vicinamibacterales bacterium]